MNSYLFYQICFYNLCMRDDVGTARTVSRAITNYITPKDGIEIEKSHREPRNSRNWRFSVFSFLGRELILWGVLWHALGTLVDTYCTLFSHQNRTEYCTLVCAWHGRSFIYSAQTLVHFYFVDVFSSLFRHTRSDASESNGLSPPCIW